MLENIAYNLSIQYGADIGQILMIQIREQLTSTIAKQGSKAIIKSLIELTQRTLDTLTSGGISVFLTTNRRVRKELDKYKNEIASKSADKVKSTVAKALSPFTNRAMPIIGRQLGGYAGIEFAENFIGNGILSSEIRNILETADENLENITMQQKLEQLKLQAKEDEITKLLENHYQKPYRRVKTIIKEENETFNSFLEKGVLTQLDNEVKHIENEYNEELQKRQKQAEKDYQKYLEEKKALEKEREDSLKESSWLGSIVKRIGHTASDTLSSTASSVTSLASSVGTTVTDSYNYSTFGTRTRLKLTQIQQKKESISQLAKSSGINSVARIAGSLGTGYLASMAQSEFEKRVNKWSIENFGYEITRSQSIRNAPIGSQLIRLETNILSNVGRGLFDLGKDVYSRVSGKIENDEELKLTKEEKMALKQYILSQEVSIKEYIADKKAEKIRKKSSLIHSIPKRQSFKDYRYRHLRQEAIEKGKQKAIHYLAEKNPVIFKEMKGLTYTKTLQITWEDYADSSKEKNSLSSSSSTTSLSSLDTTLKSSASSSSNSSSIRPPVEKKQDKKEKNKLKTL